MYKPLYEQHGRGDPGALRDTHRLERASLAQHSVGRSLTSYADGRHVQVRLTYDACVLGRPNWYIQSIVDPLRLLYRVLYRRSSAFQVVEEVKCSEVQRKQGVPASGTNPHR
jgi:hypothetical protein